MRVPFAKSLEMDELGKWIIYNDQHIMIKVN